MQTQEYIYLNSRFSIFNSNTKYHRFNLTKPIVGDSNSISLQLCEAEIPLSFYNCITDYNDKLFIKVTITGNITIDFDIKIPQQNYTSTSLTTTINALFGARQDTTLVLSYNFHTLKFSVTATYVGTVNNTKITNIIVFSSTATRLLGVSEGLSLDGSDEASLVLSFPDAGNLNRTKNIYLFTDVFDNENTNNNNIATTILSKIQTTEKFGEIVSYQNEAGIFNKIPQQNTYIDHINIKLLDDDFEFLDFNKLNFCLTLAVQLTPKKTMKYDDEDRTPIDALIDMVQQEICEE